MLIDKTCRNEKLCWNKQKIETKAKKWLKIGFFETTQESETPHREYNWKPEETRVRRGPFSLRKLRSTVLKGGGWGRRVAVHANACGLRAASA